MTPISAGSQDRTVVRVRALRRTLPGFVALWPEARV